MSVREYSPNTQNGHVETATADLASAQLDKIEHDARANVVTAKSETMRAENAERDMSAPVNYEASIAGGIALEALAPGLSMASKVLDFVDARRTDRADMGGFHGAKQSPQAEPSKPKTMDQHIVDGATRTPGLYRESVNPIHYEGSQTLASASGKKSAQQGEDLMARANIAKSSLHEQGKDAIKSWAVKDPKKMDGVTQAKKLTFGNELTSEQALNQVHVARQEQQARMQKIQQMSPGMGMGMNGPSMKMADIEKLAEDERRMNQWRTQGTA